MPTSLDHSLCLMLDRFTLKSKQQKHQVLGAELTANSDRIQSVISMGKSKLKSTDQWAFADEQR